MDGDVTDRFSSGIVVSVLGTTLAAVTLFDIYEDVALQGDPLYLTLLENALPIVFDFALIIAGALLVVGWMPHARFAKRITGWSLFGAVVLFGITGWVYYFQIRQGEIKPLFIFSHVVAMGALAGFSIGIYDSSRIERESELRIERDRTSTLFENTSDCMAAVEFVDDKPVVREINDAFRRTFEISDEDIVGKKLDEVIVPPERDDSADRINREANEGRHVEDEVFRQTASGETRVFRLQAIPLETTTATIDAYAVYTGITEQYRYESRMTALHDATRELMNAESTDEITDRAVRLTAEVLDLRAAAIFLYEPTTDRLELTTRTEEATTLVDETDAFGRGEAIAWTAFEQREPEYVPDVRKRADAYERESPIRSELILPLGEWGVLIIGSETADDFDESDRSLSRTLAANVEVVMDRAEQRQELRERNERLDTFASVISHDLRNPLGVARGFLELARDDNPEALDRAEDALDRMDRLIDTVLTLARSGDAIGEPETVSFEAVATAAWKTVETGDSTLEVEIKSDADETLRADRERFRQLLENLFRNCVEHGTEEDRSTANDGVDSGPSVTVCAVRLPCGFAIEDDGKGIPETDRDQIFEHGYSTDKGGTGLGLAIVQEIADAHGWTASVDESESGGARFSFTTPET